MLRKYLKKFEAFTPVLPLLFCAWIFLAGDFYPTSDPEGLGLRWEECRISDDAYTGVPNSVQVEKCFHHPGPPAVSDELSVPKDLHKPVFVAAYKPYELDGKPIFIGRLGVKYFIVFDGKKTGPTFDGIQTDDDFTDPVILADAYPGHYIFRGVRGGQYFLVEISSPSASQ
jgi:hypothetical protein